MLLLENLDMCFTPYPVGLSKPFLEDGDYELMVEAYPPERLFANMGGPYKKLSLSERNNPVEYKKFIMESPLWWSFYHFIKSEDFVEYVFKKLAEKADIHMPEGNYQTRFEFSSMPAYGGAIAPHTDIPSKVVTMVVPMLAKVNEWQEEWGGGTDILEQKDLNKELIDYKAPLDEFNVVATYPYEPNQCLVFIKTNNSWHSAGPFQGPKDGPYRRTLTINIERMK